MILLEQHRTTFRPSAAIVLATMAFLAGCADLRTQLQNSYSGVLPNHSVPVALPATRIAAADARHHLKPALDKVVAQNNWQAIDLPRIAELARKGSLGEPVYISEPRVWILPLYLGEPDGQKPPDAEYLFFLSENPQLHFYSVPAGDLPFDGGSGGWSFLVGSRPAQHAVVLEGGALCVKAGRRHDMGSRLNPGYSPGFLLNLPARKHFCIGDSGRGDNVAPIYNAYFSFRPAPAAWSFLDANEARAFAVLLLSAFPEIQPASASPTPMAHSPTRPLGPNT